MPTHIEKIEHIENAHFYNGYNQASSKIIIDNAIQSFFESLQQRYQNRYEQKLDGYFEITLKVSKDWNSQISQTVKEKYNEKADTGDAIKIITEAFEEKSRLLIVGNPGAGKTVLLLKLAVSLLEKCNFSERTWAFPVIFNLASWSDKYENFEDWLVTMLVNGNGLSPAFAKTLLANERFILLLDGLDELARNEEAATANEKRASCMQSLNKYLKRKCRTVICCRRHEFTMMQELTGQDAPVSAKVEVLDLTEPDVRLALENARSENFAAASNILEIAGENKAFSEILKTPFYFTTLFEIFDQQIIDEEYKSKFLSNRDYKDELFLKYNLVHHFVRKKFYNDVYPDVNYPRYIPDSLLYGILRFLNPLKEQDWIMYLAVIMEKRQLVTFELADLQPEDLNSVYAPWWCNYYLIFCLIGGIAGSLFGVLFLSIIQTPVNKITHKIQIIENIKELLFNDHEQLIIYSLTGLIIGLIGSLGASRLSRGIQTRDKYKLNIFSLFRGETWGKANEEMGERGCCFVISIWMICGFVGGLSVLLNWVNVLTDLAFVINLIAFLLFTMSNGIWLIAYLSALFNACKIPMPFAAIKTPYKRFRAGIIRVIRNIFLVIALNVLVEIWYYYHRSQSFDEIVNVGVTVALIHIVSLLLLFIIIFTMPFFKHCVLRLCFFLNGNMPLRYATFLDYAAKVRVLEKDGGYWRFRHQNIQDYLGHGLEGRLNEPWRLQK